MVFDVRLARCRLLCRLVLRSEVPHNMLELFSGRHCFQPATKQARFPIRIMPSSPADARTHRAVSTESTARNSLAASTLALYSPSRSSLSRSPSRTPSPLYELPLLLSHTGLLRQARCTSRARSTHALSLPYSALHRLLGVDEAGRLKDLLLSGEDGVWPLS